MKKLSLAFVFLYAFINQAAFSRETVDLIGDEAWIYPVMKVSHQIMQERNGVNHFLNTQVQFSPEDTRLKIEETQTAYPDKEVKVYQMSFVDAQVELPNLAPVKMRYSEQIDGWELKANYQSIPDKELARVKNFLSQQSGVNLMIGHYKRSLKEEVVFNTFCLFGGRTNEGVAWLFKRLKSFEEDVQSVLRVEKLEWEKVLNDFTRTCTAIDARGVQDFQELGALWRVKGRAEKFEIKVKKIKENYRQIQFQLESRLVIYEF